MNIEKIISIADHEPNFLDMFGETEDQVDDWRHQTEARNNDLMIRASKEISERKAATQSGFKKLPYPHFNGDILNYLEFKKQWAAEVVSERKTPALELVTLRDSIIVTAKAKIEDVTKMIEAWKLLDLEYGDLEKLRAKLRDQVPGLKIKAKKDTVCIVELKLSKHHSREVMWEWLKQDKSRWSNFYLFLENTTKIAKKQLILDPILSALSGDQGEKLVSQVSPRKVQ